jgi:hypothetical protein
LTRRSGKIEEVGAAGGGDAAVSLQLLTGKE